MELLVVIVIIGLLTAVLVPEMRGTFEETLLRSSARELVGACGIAYSRAVAEGEVHRLHFEPATGHYEIRRRPRPDGAPPDPAGPGSRRSSDLRDTEGTIDPRIVVQLAPPDSATAPPTAEPGSGPGVDFFPDGTADAAEFILKDRAGFRLALKINPVTARARVRELARP
jgi:type II secretory pathway pseudopilin PulG